MEGNTIKKLVKLRLVVYNLGVEHNLWKSLEDNGAQEMLDYIFPKTGKIAYYNLVVETVKAAHKDYVPVGEYSLFKLPVQYESEILNFIKGQATDDLWEIPEDKTAYLKGLCTVDCQPVLNPVNLGSLKDTGVDSIIAMCAFHYLNIFRQGTLSYPYFG